MKALVAVKRSLLVPLNHWLIAVGLPSISTLRPSEANAKRASVEVLAPAASDSCPATTAICTRTPAALEVIDESHQHAGHSGARSDGESHFRVRIVAEAFRGKSRVDQHRMVNAALAEELKERVHALAIQASAP